MRQLLIRSIALVSLFTCSSNCEKMSIQSTWTADPLVIDGKLPEWQSRLNDIDGKGIAAAVMNDSRSIYICLVSENENFNRQAFMQGFTLWFKHRSLKSGKLGVRFIPAVQRVNPPQQSMESADNNKPVIEPTPELQTLELIGPGKDSTIVAATVAIRYGIETAFGKDDGKVISEIRLPLHDMDSTLFSLRMASDTLLTLTAETNAMKKPGGDHPPMQGRTPPGGNRGMGPPPEGMRQGGGQGGMRPMGGMQPPLQVRFECQVVLAKTPHPRPPLH
ncbi:MAG: hypothetical protein ACM31E_03865 [Fibrobacterota bacterium]|nr:hypothetical protein [Chitinispirillaceae bacterium]